MFKFLFNPLFWTAIFLVIVLYNIIDSLSDKQKTKQQRKQSSFLCYHCGAPMLESDVFCESCWKITPNVQEMLNAHPKRKPKFYSDLYYRGHNHCPHCKAFYCEGRTIDSTLTLSPPIKHCPKCHQYFLDSWHIEWSVSSLFAKSELFSVIRLWVYLLFVPALICCFAYKNWFALQGIAIFSIGYFALRFIWYKTEKKKKIHESYMRLSQNPEYPQILIDMGYQHMMSKKYHHLSKEVTITWQSKLKELLKDAVTFD